MSNQTKHKAVIEAALFASTEPLSLNNLQQLFTKEEALDTNALKAILTEIEKEFEDRGVELKRVASGFRFQAREEYAPWLSRLWQQKPPRYSRALLETLSLIAYRQPITRGEIEEVRGVAVSTDIIKKLLEREWIKAVGHKDVPGKPSLFATTKAFLDYFNLKNLSDLPALEEVVDLEQIESQLKEQLALDMKVERVEVQPQAEEEQVVVSAELEESSDQEPEQTNQ